MKKSMSDRYNRAEHLILSVPSLRISPEDIKANNIFEIEGVAEYNPFIGYHVGDYLITHGDLVLYTDEDGGEQVGVCWISTKDHSRNRCGYMGASAVDPEETPIKLYRRPEEDPNIFTEWEEVI